MPEEGLRTDTETQGPEPLNEVVYPRQLLHVLAGSVC